MEILDFIQIGMRIRKQRELLNITKDRLAGYLDVTPKFISDIETGARGMSLQTLSKISIILKMSTDYILFRKDEQTQKSDISLLIEAFNTCPPEKVEYATQLLKLFLQALN